MDGKRVTIKYQYYQLCTIIGDETTEYTYDLREWIGRLKSLSLQDRIKDIDGISGRLENIALVHNDEFYVLNFMRLDVVSNTYVLAPDTMARHVDLGENEYIGKNTVVLYDPRYHVAMVQCNRGSYGTFALQSYVNSFIGDGNLCYFRPIDYDYDNVDLLKKQFLKLDVRFANTRGLVSKNSKTFEDIIKLCNQVECKTAHLEFGLGYNYGHHDELEAETMQGIVREIRSGDNRELISSARITLSDDQKSEVFDLLQNILNDKINYKVPPRGELSFYTLSKEMSKKYSEGGSRAQIANLLKKG